MDIIKNHNNKIMQNESYKLVFKRKTILSFLLLVLFFPNISFGILNLDTQPFPLLASLLILGLANSYSNCPRIFLLLWVPFIFSSILLYQFVDDPPSLLRQVAIYGSPPLISLAVYKALVGGVDIVKILKAVLWISLLGSVLQLAFTKEILNIFLSARTTENRGFTSFFIEPSFYGLTMVMVWLMYVLEKNEIKLFCTFFFAIFLSVVVFSQSALAIIVLWLLICIYLVRNHYFKTAFSSLIIVSIILFVQSDIALNFESENSRTLYLLTVILQNPMEILTLDASISERFFHLYLSISGFFQNYLLPNGFESFSELIESEKQFNRYFWYGEPTNKIMSGLGGALYELGIISIVYLYLPLHFYLKSSRSEKNVLFFVIMGTYFVYFNSLNLASPYYSILLGILAYRAHLADHKFRTYPIPDDVNYSQPSSHAYS